MDPALLDRFDTCFKNQKIAVIGDFALDFYFKLTTNTNEFSVETEKEVFHGKAPRTYLGGAGNVCKNLSHLGCQSDAFGIIGDDLFGREMIHQMTTLSINHSNILIDASKGTPVYSKPMEDLVEYHRIDFGTTTHINQTLKTDLLFQTCLQIHSFDGIILNEQFLIPLLEREDLTTIQQEIKASNIFAIADFRSLGKDAIDVILKINLKEFSKLVGVEEHTLKDPKVLEKFIKKLMETRNKGLLVTLGEQGIMYADQSKIVHKNAIPIKGQIDTVGAGDMVVAAFTAAILAGANEAEACEFANLCAHISIHKIGETGSASIQEIISYEL